MQKLSCSNANLQTQFIPQKGLILQGKAVEALIGRDFLETSELQGCFGLIFDQPNAKKQWYGKQEHICPGN